MRIIVFLSLIVFLPISIFSQEKLKITYEGIYSLDESNSENRFPRSFVPSTFELIIDGNLSEFRYIEKIHSQQEDSRLQIPMTSDNYYIDLNSNVFFVRQEIFGKPFLVSDTLKAEDWKLTREESEVAGILVRKATIKIDGDEITAWYAPKIAYKVGPELFGGLPGIILQLDIYSITQEKAVLGQHYKANKIEVLNDKYRVKLPKGDTISLEDAERISEEQYNKIIEMNSGGVEID